MANYTEHHQLHQWEPGDPFLRTDFNEDFAKIDGALGRLLPMTVLHDITLEEDANYLEFDMAGEKWSGHSVMSCRTVSLAHDVNNSSGGSHYDIARVSEGSKPYLAKGYANVSLTLLLFPAGSGASIRSLAAVPGSFHFGCSSLGYDDPTYPLWVKGRLQTGARFRAVALL